MRDPRHSRAEYGDPIVLDANTTDESLGLALCDKLLEFKPRSDQDISKAKLDDWAAYKASGAKSGKAFEQKSTYIYVTTINSTIHIEAAPRVTNEPNLKALCSFPMGVHIQKLEQQFASPLRRQHCCVKQVCSNNAINANVRPTSEHARGES